MDDIALSDPLALDRDVRATVEGLTRARRAFARGAVDDVVDPFRRRRNVATKATFDGLATLPSDPLFTAMRAFVGALTIVRVTFADEAAIAEAFAAREHLVEALAEPTSALAAFRALLAEPTDGRRAELSTTLLATLGNTRDALVRHSERRKEAVRLLGADPAAIDTGALARVASGVLRDVAEMIVRREPLSFDQAFDRALGRDAADGWPANLGPRWLADIFENTRLTEGLRLDLGTLPPALGATSFCRALARFSEAVVHADVPRGTSYVLARAPNDVLPFSRGALFGALPADATFAERVLGLGRVRAREQVRRVATALTTSIAIDAIGTLTSIAFFDSPESVYDAFEELTARTFGAPWPRALAAVLPRARVDRPLAFAGSLVAASERARLRDAYDEDWFKNPRAHEALRHEHAQSPAPPKEEELERGRVALLEALRGALG